MQCPVCGEDHIHTAPDLISKKNTFFSPCPDCSHVVRDKHVPPDDSPSPVCSCGKAFIDDVFVRLYYELVDAGLFTGTEPLCAVGTPLIDPGLFLRTPPHIPPRSILMISTAFDSDTAKSAYQAIPQVSGILASSNNPPGIGDLRSSSNEWSEYSVLCGCDVRADVFRTSRGPVVVYKKQGSIHIEFPHAFDPKISSLEAAIRKNHPCLLVDACSGSGTLGLCGLRMGIEHAILNDPWYAAAFFSGFNLLVNQEILGLDDFTFSMDFPALSREPVRHEPCTVAQAFGPEKSVEIIQGRMEFLPPRITKRPVLTAFDPFDKASFVQNQSFLSFWNESVGGEVIIP